MWIEPVSWGIPFQGPIELTVPENSDDHHHDQRPRVPAAPEPPADPSRGRAGPDHREGRLGPARLPERASDRCPQGQDDPAHRRYHGVADRAHRQDLGARQAERPRAVLRPAVRHGPAGAGDPREADRRGRRGRRHPAQEARRLQGVGHRRPLRDHAGVHQRLRAEPLRPLCGDRADPRQRLVGRLIGDSVDPLPPLLLNLLNS